MRKLIAITALAVGLSFIGSAAQAADNCCSGDKCGTCCVNCTQCGSHCSPNTCCKK